MVVECQEEMEAAAGVGEVLVAPQTMPREPRAVGQHQFLLELGSSDQKVVPVHVALLHSDVAGPEVRPAPLSGPPKKY